MATPRQETPESFASLHQRNFAVQVLQSYEKLSWYSIQRCESLAQTRLHFQNMVAGLDEFEEALVDWPIDNSPHPGDATQPNNTARKGKERLSAGNEASGSKQGSRDGRKSSKGKAMNGSRHKT